MNVLHLTGFCLVFDPLTCSASSRSLHSPNWTWPLPTSLPSPPPPAQRMGPHPPQPRPSLLTATPPLRMVQRHFRILSGGVVPAPSRPGGILPPQHHLGAPCLSQVVWWKKAWRPLQLRCRARLDPPPPLRTRPHSHLS